MIMYLDMIHEKIIELKGIDQFVDYKNLQAGTVSAFATANSAIGRFNKALDVGGATGGASSAGPIGVTAALASSAKEKLLKKTLSSAQLLGKQAVAISRWHLSHSSIYLYVVTRQAH